MKFARFGAPGAEIPAVLDDEGRAHDLSSVTPDLNGAFWADGGVARARRALADGSLPALDTTDLRTGSPITRPSAIVCIGMNYAAHAAESNSAPPAVPILFSKTPNTVVGPFDDVTIPKDSTKTDWEVELGVVIGRRTSYLDSPAQSRDHIAGYVLANDLSERTFQIEVSGGQWGKGKSCAGFCPTGPYLVPADEIDGQNLSLASWVNGEPRQDSHTSDMIFSIDFLIHSLSQYLVLEPGDLVLTGTPEGVALSGRFPYLRDGDVVELEIEGLGRQRQNLRAYRAEQA